MAPRRSSECSPSFSRRSDPSYGGVIELVGGLAVMLGFHTRIAAFLCSGMMAVAYIQFHWIFQGGPELFPAINKGELAVLYCFVFLLIACRGGIKWCLDKRD
jgi:putative oxidoreductase